MNKNLQKFMETETRSKAHVVDDYHVEIQTPDGEVFTILSGLAKYENEEFKTYVLHLIEYIFDRNYSDDKEKMIQDITREFLLNAVPMFGMDSGSRQSERVRLGKRIRELREKKGMEAKDLAMFAGIDAANLSRIEQGKYSTGIDILSSIAAILGAHIDIIPNEG